MEISQLSGLYILNLAAASPQSIAIELPLTNPATVSEIRLKSSFNQFSTTVSNYDVIGDVKY